jgi:hypothetical protein
MIGYELREPNQHRVAPDGPSMQKKPRASMGSTAGQASAFGLSGLSALRQYGISGAQRQPSETTRAMVRQEKAPHEGTRTGQAARLGLRGKN